MLIYPLRRGIVGKPINYTGPYLISKKELLAMFGNRKQLATLKLPKSVVHIDPSTRARSYATRALALV